MSRYIDYNARDARPLKIRLDRWIKKYNLPADIIKKILKKTVNSYAIDEDDEYTDEEIERFIVY